MNNNVFRGINLSVALLLAGWVVLSGESHAAEGQTGDSVELTFGGRLQAMTSCSINNDGPVTLAFGNVGINKVDSGLYLRQLNYILDCGAATASNTVLMSFTTTTPVASEPAAISSNIPGLWMKILKDGVPLELGKEFQVADPQNPPKIEVQLMRESGTNLSEGAFKATGTLVAEYM